jgi:hypothetical protein
VTDWIDRETTDKVVLFARAQIKQQGLYDSKIADEFNKHGYLSATMKPFDRNSVNNFLDTIKNSGGDLCVMEMDYLELDSLVMKYWDYVYQKWTVWS